MKTVIVTGSTGGLGCALTEELIKNIDNRVICVYRNEKKFAEVIEPLINSEIPFDRYKTSDADDYSEMCKMFDNTTDEVILILSAFSIVPIKKIGDFEPDEISKMVDGNIKSNVMIINSVVSWCKINGKQMRLINIDSGAADYPLSGWANYGAGKAYINRFISVLDLEMPEYKVVSIDPGVMDTDMQARIRETSAEVFDKVDTFIGYKNDGTLNRPKDVAAYIIDRYVDNWKTAELREKYR